MASGASSSSTITPTRDTDPLGHSLAWPHSRSGPAPRTTRRDHMHLRYRILLPLLALCTTLAVPAFAAKPSPTQAGTPDQPPIHVDLGTITAPACQLGILGPPASAF